MKKAILFLAVLILILSIAACGNGVSALHSADVDVDTVTTRNGRLYTGSYEYLSTQTDVPTEFQLADVNCDGNITSLDLLVIFKYLYNSDLYPIENGNGASAIFDLGDVDKDGDITNSDLLMIFKNIYAPDTFILEGTPVGELPPSQDAVKTYVCGDGAVLEQYENMTGDNFSDACKYLRSQGFKEYCSDSIGNSLSATYIKNDEYYTLLFANKSGTLYIEHSESGATSLPEQNEEYDSVCETTVTQGYSKNINGMTYIVRLADGSFIVVDGGYSNDAENLYNTLVKLHGAKSGMRIRAWLISHSHEDHYPAFGTFADNYADKVTLESVMYSPVPEDVAAATDTYLNGAILDDIAKYDGAKAVTVHAGMVFKLADVTLEILNTPEYVYKDYATLDFNESSVVYRVKNDNGSVIFLGDCYSKVSRFLIDTYGEALKTEMMQVSHHGVEQATVELYDIIAPSLAFWPCNESLLNNERGTTTKQYLLSNENIHEHIIHEYGNATRPLSYKAEPKETLQLITGNISLKGSAGTSGASLTDGTISYAVSGSDPHVYFALPDKISTEDYNAAKIVIKIPGASVYQAQFFFTCGDDELYKFNTTHKKDMGPQGISEDGTYTLIVYLGNTANYTGDFKAVRVDAGYEVGQTVEIYSIELFHIDIDE